MGSSYTVHPLGFRAKLSTTQTLAVAGTPEKVEFDTVVFDQTAGFNTTDHQWVASKSGLVLLHGSVFNNEFSGSVIRIFIYKNGILFAEFKKTQVATGQESYSVECVDNALKGDTYAVWYSSDGTALNIFGNSDGPDAAAGTFFEGAFL